MGACVGFSVGKQVGNAVGDSVGYFEGIEVTGHAVLGQVLLGEKDGRADVGCPDVGKAVGTSEG